MATLKTFYVQVEINLDEEWDVLSLFDDFQNGTIVPGHIRLELNEMDGFDGVVTRVADKPF